jgi:hypothetical protein
MISALTVIQIGPRQFELPPDMPLSADSSPNVNRQEEHFRRVELAVAFYGDSLLNGTKPSIKSLQRVSALSWSDANKLVSRPFFEQLVFEYQCRCLLYEPVARSCEVCTSIVPAPQLGPEG